MGQFSNSVAGYNNRLEQEARQIDQLNHILGSYIAFATHDPKKYPSKPYTHKEKKTKLMSFDQFEELARKKYGKKK